MSGVINWERIAFYATVIVYVVTTVWNYSQLSATVMYSEKTNTRLATEINALKTSVTRLEISVTALQTELKYVQNNLQP